MFGRTAPSAPQLRVKGHEPRELTGNALGAVTHQHKHPREADQVQRRLLGLPVARHLEYLPAVFGVQLSASAFEEKLHLDVLARPPRRIDGEVHAERERLFQFPGVPSHAHDGLGAEELGPLGQEYPQSAGHTHDNDPVAGSDPGSPRGLVGRRHGVGDHGKLGEREAPPSGHGAEFPRRYRYVRGEASVHAVAVARHLLAEPPAGPAFFTDFALPARDDVRDDDFAAYPRLFARNHGSAYLMTEDEGGLRRRRYAVKKVPDVRAADAAARNLDQGLTVFQLRRGDVLPHDPPDGASALSGVFGRHLP